jgi:hypothetical protein
LSANFTEKFRPKKKEISSLKAEILTIYFYDSAFRPLLPENGAFTVNKIFLCPGLGNFAEFFGSTA